jgi:hypothetical protein
VQPHLRQPGDLHRPVIPSRMAGLFSSTLLDCKNVKSFCNINYIVAY